jgi:transposase-like protein
VIPLGEGSKYSDQLKISALAAYDLDGRIRTTAKQFNIPPSTLTKWIEQRKEWALDVQHPEERIELTKNELLKETKIVMDKALKVIDKKIGDCNAYQAATIYGILFDKAERIEGASKEQNAGTINNFIIGSLGESEAVDLMIRAAERMKGKKIIEGTGEEIPGADS